MEIEVMIPSPAVDFNFDSACTSPYISAPSSPQRFGNSFFSAPTSPTRASSFYREFNNFCNSDAAATDNSLSEIPFNWEEKPGIPKTEGTKNINHDDDTEFAFDFSGHLERTSLSADELFDGGKIKPLKPPPRLQYSDNGMVDSPKSPRSHKNMFREALSPRHRRKDFDPFAAAIEQTRREHSQEHTNKQRGRERTHNSSGTATIRHKATRSLSPFRVSDILFDQETNQQSPKNSSSSSTSGSAAWYRKWNLKDFLLFRSASEGRATDKNLKNYDLLKKNHHEDVNSSFRSTGSSGSVSSSRRRVPVSAHELHYKVNRTVSEQMRKKTFLPYRQGLLGCLGFNPGGYEISKGLGSLARG
ncbi:unnamed protein product [Ilex paraguariensis]|uniref:Calmodulin-binding protein n=1 Tax=Ilex paraguariensis TaxID=185542 RepID=A0ABC8UFE0_9AQUA